MFKFDRLVLCVMLVGVVAVAWGAATKIPSFVVKDTASSCSGVCSDTGGLCFEDPCSSGAACVGIGEQFPIGLDLAAADGMAILNYVSGQDKTIVQVIVSDFTGAPLDRFIVKLNPGDGMDLADIGSFLVGSQGNGHFHGEISGDKSGWNVELWQQVEPPFPPANCPAVLIANGV